MKALVLAGGGAKGAFQVGVLQRLEESGVRFDSVYGTSTGALNTIGYSFGGVPEMTKIWQGIRGPKDIIRLNWYNLLWSRGAYSTKPLRSIIEGHLKRFPKPRCQAWVCYVDFRDGGLYYRGSHETEFSDAVLASASIPFALEPVQDFFVDGGVRETAPLKRAIDDGASEITVILCQPWNKNPDFWTPERPYLISYGIRAIDVMTHEILVNDIERCIRDNSRAGKKRIKLTLYAPDRTPMSALDFDPKKIAATIDLGRSASPVGSW